jgi:hypothetical protein
VRRVQDLGFLRRVLLHTVQLLFGGVLQEEPMPRVSVRESDFPTRAANVGPLSCLTARPGHCQRVSAWAFIFQLYILLVVMAASPQLHPPLAFSQELPQNTALQSQQALPTANPRNTRRETPVSPRRWSRGG